jgi:hypothetical protein
MYPTTLCDVEYSSLCNFALTATDPGARAWNPCATPRRKLREIFPRAREQFGGDVLRDRDRELGQGCTLGSAHALEDRALGSAGDGRERIPDRFLIVNENHAARAVPRRGLVLLQARAVVRERAPLEVETVGVAAWVLIRTTTVLPFTSLPA